MSVSAPRSTTIRDQHRRIIRRNKPPCGICLQPIDYTLRSPDPGSFEVDHITAIINGGTDTLDNKQASHRSCNRAKWHRIETQTTAATTREYVTHRTW